MHMWRTAISWSFLGAEPFIRLTGDQGPTYWANLIYLMVSNVLFLNIHAALLTEEKTKGQRVGSLFKFS